MIRDYTEQANGLREPNVEGEKLDTEAQTHASIHIESRRR